MGYYQLLLTASSYDNVSILHYILFDPNRCGQGNKNVAVISYRLFAINLKRQSVDSHCSIYKENGKCVTRIYIHPLRESVKFRYC